MSVRPSMASLIGRTRTLIFDTPVIWSPQSIFNDQQIQDALDAWREERRWVALRPLPTFQPGGNIVYLDYYHDAQDWEDDTQFQDMSYATITPSVFEPLVGHWAFTTQPTGIGVRVTGKTYDLYNSAADLLTWWTSQLKLKAFSVKIDDLAINYQQQISTLMTLAETYRSRALPHTRRMYQGDAAPDQDGSGVTYPSVRSNT